MKSPTPTTEKKQIQIQFRKLEKLETTRIHDLIERLTYQA